jgi:hypothetical protein
VPALGSVRQTAIGGGTLEMARNVIAERVLGMREQALDRRRAPHVLRGLRRTGDRLRLVNVAELPSRSGSSRA